MHLLPLGRSRCSLGCFWRDANLLLLHAVSFFCPSSASWPAPLLVPRSQLLWGYFEASAENLPRLRESSGQACRRPAGQPRMGAGTRLFHCCWVGGHHPSPRLSSSGNERASRPLPRLRPAICSGRCVTEPSAGCGA